MPISSIQLNRVEIKCSSLSNTAAKLAYASTGNLHVRLYRAAVARNTLIAYVKLSLSLHIELNQEGKQSERKVSFLFLSHFLSAAVNRRGQILMEVHPPLCSTPIATTTIG